MAISVLSDDDFPELPVSSASDEDVWNPESGSSEVDEVFCTVRGRESLKATKRKKTTDQVPCNGGLPNYYLGIYDKEYWHAEGMTEYNGKFIRLQDKQYGPEYIIPARRINKALRFLHMPSIQEQFNGKNLLCRCKRKCADNGWDATQIAKLRYEYFKQPTEYMGTVYLANTLRHVQETTADTTIRWVVQGVDVCPAFFGLLYGISASKLQQVRLAITDGNTLPPPRVESSRVSKKYSQCKHFWREFFKTCQRPNRTMRLFPVNASYPTLYEDYFIPFFKKHYADAKIENIPSMSTFSRARHDCDFDDVKHRSRHHHNRCCTCAKLQATRLRGFKDEYDKQKFENDFEAHDKEKTEWREYEEKVKLEAKHNPEALNVYWYDDTEKMGLPKFTKREHKNLPTSRFFVIPFLLSDLARGLDRYVYTPAGRFKKGANRLCTTLYYAFLATKSANVPASRAKRLILIADNFCENKNNTMFAFCSMLVMLGWYDTIELMYGPPGHTHNGGDQQHQIHNEILGNFTSCAFPHLISRYPQAWRSEHSRPEPTVLDVQYDWDAFFRPYMNPVSGFQNTTQDPSIVRGFRFSRDPNGVVTMKWKMRAECGEWKGVDGQEGSPGFVVLRGIPRGMPAVIDPTRYIMQKKHYNQLMGTKLQQCCEAEGEPEAMKWNGMAAQHGVLPLDAHLQENFEVSPGNLGTKVKLRCGETTAEVQLITQRNVSAEEFWALPASLTAYREDELKRLALREAIDTEHACIGYANVSAVNRDTYVGSARERLTKEKAATVEAEHKGSDSESTSDEDQPLHKTNASRHAPQLRSNEAQEATDAATSVEEKVYDVYVLFGEHTETKDPELWFGLKVSNKAKNTTLASKDEKNTWRIQWLAEVKDDKVTIYNYYSYINFFMTLHINLCRTR